MLDGSLRVVPQRKEQFADLDLDAWGLLPVAVDVWEGMVFADPDPTAPPLTEWLGRLPAHIGSHHPGQLPLVAQVDIPARCNWKLLVENHIDVYHLWYLHRESLGDLDHHQFEHHQLGPHWASYEPLRDMDLANVRLVKGTVPIADLDERDRHGVGAHLIFPSILLAANVEFFMSYAVVPDGPTDSHIEVRIKAEPGADGEALVQAARSFVDEDVDALRAHPARPALPHLRRRPSRPDPRGADHRVPRAAPGEAAVSEHTRTRARRPTASGAQAARCRRHQERAR